MRDADSAGVGRQQIIRGIIRMGATHRRAYHRAGRPSTQAADEPLALPRSLEIAHDA